MSPRAAYWLAWVVCAVALSVMALVLVLILLGLSTPLPQGQTPWRDQAVSLVEIVGAPVLGGLIPRRPSFLATALRPRSSSSFRGVYTG